MPLGLMVGSLFSIVGIITLPLIPIYGIAFFSSKCSLWRALPLTGLVWLNIYAAIHWAHISTTSFND